MFEKLQSDYQRFLEIERSLLDPDITADPSRVAVLARERGALAKLAVPYGRYLELGRQIAEAEALHSGETDPEMRSYAESELDSLRERQSREGESLRYLTPRAVIADIEKRGLYRTRVGERREMEEATG